jgi:Gametolysin peptidase M11
MVGRFGVVAIVFLAVVLLAPGVSHAHEGDGDAVTMEGTLEFRHSDDFRNRIARYYYSLRQGGRHVTLDFPRFRRDLRTGARLRVRGTLKHGRLSVEHLRRLHREPIRTFAATGPGPRRVLVLLVNFSNNTSQPYTPAQAAATMFGGPTSVSSYFQEESYGATTLSGDVFGWYTLPVANSGCAIDAWTQAANAAATAAGVVLTNYQHVVYAFPLASSCGFSGLAEMPGSRVWVNGSFTLRVLGHELSHNLGVHHAASLSCTSGVVRVPLSDTCSYNEYGDPFDIMGSSARHTSSWHKAQIGWLDPLAQQTVTTSGTYTITPQEWESGGVKALRVARGTTGNYFYLEYRRPYATSFDTFSVSDPVVNGVTIRMAPDYSLMQLSYLIDATSTTSSYADAALAVGQTFTDEAYDISIKTISVSATGATVEIGLPGSPVPAAPADASAPAPPRAPPTNIALPTIAGTTQQGSTLTAAVRTWAGAGPMKFTFRWLRCNSYRICSAIGSATASTYKLTRRDVGRTIRVAVTASNTAGSATATSATTATIRAPSARRRRR